MAFDALADDKSVFLADFGVSATSGSTTGNVILDEPTQKLVGDLILSTDYQITAEASDFGTLTAGTSITVDSVAYTVRETRLIDDGLLCEISLQKT